MFTKDLLLEIFLLSIEKWVKDGCSEDEVIVDLSKHLEMSEEIIREILELRE